MAYSIKMLGKLANYLEKIVSSLFYILCQKKKKKILEGKLWPVMLSTQYQFPLFNNRIWFCSGQQRVQIKIFTPSRFFCSFGWPCDLLLANEKSNKWDLQERYGFPDKIDGFRWHTALTFCPSPFLLNGLQVWCPEWQQSFVNLRKSYIWRIIEQKCGMSLDPWRCNKSTKPAVNVSLPEKKELLLGVKWL